MVAARPSDAIDGKVSRKYRSECIIVNDMLRLIEQKTPEGIKKTPLMNFMNMNSSSFNTYKSMLEAAGLIEKRISGGNGRGNSEVLVITGTGRLALNIIEMFICIYNARRLDARILAGDYAKAMAERHGGSVLKDQGLVDYVVVSPTGDKVGLIGAVCERDRAEMLALIVKAVTNLNKIVVVRLAENQVDVEPRISNLSSDIVVVDVPASGVESKKLVHDIADSLTAMISTGSSLG